MQTIWTKNDIPRTGTVPEYNSTNQRLDPTTRLETTSSDNCKVHLQRRHHESIAHVDNGDECKQRTSIASARRNLTTFGKPWDVGSSVQRGRKCGDQRFHFLRGTQSADFLCTILFAALLRLYPDCRDNGARRTPVVL